jgi:hypothetical protein
VRTGGKISCSNALIIPYTCKCHESAPPLGRLALAPSPSPPSLSHSEHVRLGSHACAEQSRQRRATTAREGTDTSGDGRVPPALHGCTRAHSNAAGECTAQLCEPLPSAANSGRFARFSRVSVSSSSELILLCSFVHCVPPKADPAESRRDCRPPASQLPERPAKLDARRDKPTWTPPRRLLLPCSASKRWLRCFSTTEPRTLLRMELIRRWPLLSEAMFFAATDATEP